MTKVNFVKKARNDIEGTDIKKGDSYYNWKFRYGDIQRSKTYPDRNQLTQNGFKLSIYEIEDNISSFDDYDTFEEFLCSIVEEIETLMDECSEKLDNMPEQLKEAPSGEILQNRIDSLDELRDELQNFDFSLDEDDYNSEDEFEQAKNDKIEELNNICYNGE